MSRPTGITALAAMWFALAESMLIAGISLFARFSGLALLIVCILFPAGAALCALVGWGLWNLKNWGRILTIVLLAASSANKLHRVDHWTLALALALNGAQVGYLLLPNVRAAFQAPPVPDILGS